MHFWYEICPIHLGGIHPGFSVEIRTTRTSIGRDLKPYRFKKQRSLSRARPFLPFFHQNFVFPGEGLCSKRRGRTDSSAEWPAATALLCDNEVTITWCHRKWDYLTKCDILSQNVMHRHKTWQKKWHGSKTVITIHWRVPINLMIKGTITQPRVIRCDFAWECVKNQGVKISCESHTPWSVRCHHNIYF